MRLVTWSIVTIVWLGTGCGDDLFVSGPPPHSSDTAGSTGSPAASSSDDDTDTDTAGGDLDHFPGLSAPVEVLIDQRGIPHLYGQTDADVMYGSGYQMATDRLFQMDLVRRRALGRQAEALGASSLSQDEVSRLFDLPRWGAANAQRIRDQYPETYRLLVAWIAGVNARITEVNEGTAPLPYGFGPEQTNTMPEPWTVADHSAIGKLMMLGNSNSLERELLITIIERNFPEAWERIELARPAFNISTMPPEELPAAALGRPRQQPARKPPIPATKLELVEGMKTLHRAFEHLPTVGSNNWAIDGRFTETGRPLIAGDPHQPLQSPSLMYTQHINSADAQGQLDVIGWSFAGTAGVQLGHNRAVHWTATTNFADVMDVWEVEHSGGYVRIGDQMVPTHARTEHINIAGEAPQLFEIIDVPGYGVLLPNDIVPLPIAAPGHALLLNWTGFKATIEEQTFLKLAQARDIDQFEAAADTMQVGGFNFVAASADEISYRVQIDIPDRGDPSARPMPFSVIDGNDPQSFWDGTFLSPEKLPRTRAGQRGWVATANNDPWGFTFDGDVSNDPWYYGYFFAAGHRAQRIDTQLRSMTAAGGITLEDMQSLQSDTHSALSDVLLPKLREAWQHVDTDPALEPYRNRPELRTLHTLLNLEWDQSMERDQPGALAFHLLVMLLTDEVLRDELSLLYATVLGAEASFVIKIPVLGILGQYPRSSELLGAASDVVLLQSLARVADVLQQRFGSVDPTGYRWGDLHGTDLRNPLGGALAGGWWPSDGGEDTVNVSSSAFLNNAGTIASRFDSHSGAIFRVTTTFAEDGIPEAFCNFVPGNSADPQSPHFQDTRDAWLDDQYTYLPFRRAEVEAASETRRFIDP